MAILVWSLGCGPTGPAPAVRPEQGRFAGVEARVQDVLARHSPHLTAGLWLEDLESGAVFRRSEDVPLPSASAIKTAYMVELFAAFPELDRPLPGLDAILAGPAHPAVAHFDEATRREIREVLRGATVRRIARAMIRGDGVSNAVYNAAANVVTAVLGGPAALTRRLHRRDPAWSGLHVRRYMLAARDVTGDNEATASSLAAVLRGVAREEVPRLDVALYAPMRDILAVADPPLADVGGRHFFKSGALDSDPPVRILSGWWEQPGGETLLYVVVVASPGGAGTGAGSDGPALQRVAEELRAALLGERIGSAAGAPAAGPGPVRVSLRTARGRRAR